jgi:YD repeat-containing protein
VSLIACGGSDLSQRLPGPTSATRLGLEDEVIETISYKYVAAGRLTERISSDRRIRFFYDGDDRLALVDFVAPNEDNVEEQIVYRYDALDRVERFERQVPETGEVLQSTRFEYDVKVVDRVVLREDENPHSVTDPKRAFAYRYDAAGRLLKEQPMSKGQEVHYVYVDNGVLRHRDIGDVRRIFEFDEHGNMLSEATVSVHDETHVHQRWIYGYEGWETASDEEKNAPRTNTPYLSATVR